MISYYSLQILANWFQRHKFASIGIFKYLLFANKPTTQESMQRSPICYNVTKIAHKKKRKHKKEKTYFKGIYFFPYN